MKRWHKIILFIFLFVFFTFLFTITEAEEKWKHISKEQGLPSRFIKCIKSDGRYLWIGTANGLVKYDIKRKRVVKIFKSRRKGLIDNYITDILIDGNTVWIGTAGGLSRYNKKTGKFINYTKGKGLSDNFVTSLVKDGDYIWVGTSLWGVDRYDKSTRRWENFSILQGLIDNSVTCLLADESFVWVGTKKGLSFYDRLTGLWDAYDVTRGLPNNEITSIDLDGEYIWCGTAGGLAQINKYEQTVKTFTTSDGLADDYVLSVKVDGRYIWVGTFSGVSRYDKKTGKWITYTTTEGLSENSVSAIEIDGNYIWFGTDGGGLSRFDKLLPQAFISPLSHYFKPGRIKIIGSAFSYYGIKKYKLSYKSDSMAKWVSSGINIKSDEVKTGILAEWNVKKLMNNVIYYLKLETYDKKGRKNVYTKPFVIDTKPPRIVVDYIPEAIKEPTLILRGKFIEENLLKIIIKPQNITAKVNKLTRRFIAEIPLKKGENNIEVIGFDIANQKGGIKFKIIYDAEKPEIVLDKYPEEVKVPEVILKGKVKDSSLQKLILNPGKVNIKFKQEKPGIYSFKVKAKLKTGENLLQLVAYDKVGNKTTVYPRINYAGTFPYISLDKSKLKVTSPFYTVKGTWSDNNIDYIFIEPFKKRAKINYKKRTFSLKVKLQEGENLITATIYDKDKQSNFDVMTVVYEKEGSRIEITEASEYTKEKEVTIKGKYKEKNLSKIYVLPGKKSAVVDFKKKKFFVKVDLKSEKNKFTVVLLDKYGNKTKADVTIIRDTIPPKLNIDKLPQVVSVPQIKIKGTFKEKYIDKIIINPGERECKVDYRNSKFEGIVTLNKGDNELEVVAFDKAGNKTVKKIKIVYTPGVVVTAAETEDIKKLKEEIRRLKELLKTRRVIRITERPKKFRISHKKSAFFLIPVEKNKSLVDIVKKTYGNLVYFKFITEVNFGRRNEENRIVLPSKRLLIELRKLNSNLKEIMKLAGISYYYSGGNPKKFKKHFISSLIRKNIISVEQGIELVKKGTTKIDGLVIGFKEKKRKGIYFSPHSETLLVSIK